AYSSVAPIPRPPLPSVRARSRATRAGVATGTGCSATGRLLRRSGEASTSRSSACPAMSCTAQRSTSWIREVTSVRRICFRLRPGRWPRTFVVWRADELPPCPVGPRDRRDVRRLVLARVAAAGAASRCQSAPPAFDPVAWSLFRRRARRGRRRAGLPPRPPRRRLLLGAHAAARAADDGGGAA